MHWCRSTEYSSSCPDTNHLSEFCSTGCLYLYIEASPLCGAIVMLNAIVVKITQQHFGSSSTTKPVYRGLLWVIFLRINWSMARSSLMLMKYSQVGLDMAFFSFLPSLKNRTFTRFLMFSIDFPYAVLERSLKKISRSRRWPFFVSRYWNQCKISTSEIVRIQERVEFLWRGVLSVCRVSAFWCASRILLCCIKLESATSVCQRETPYYRRTACLW